MSCAPVPERGLHSQNSGAKPTLGCAPPLGALWCRGRQIGRSCTAHLAEGRGPTGGLHTGTLSLLHTADPSSHYHQDVVAAHALREGGAVFCPVYFLQMFAQPRLTLLSPAGDCNGGTETLDTAPALVAHGPAAKMLARQPCRDECCHYCAPMFPAGKAVNLQTASCGRS